MKNEERREITIRKLLDATVQLLAERGCHAITMKDIMDRSALSKGAIFHYVKSKDEIFAWVLLERLEETHRRFMLETEKSPKTFEGPMEAIARSLESLENASDATNKIVKYLLGKEDEPAIAEALDRFYRRSVELSRLWIEIGQQHGVIRSAIDPEQTAEMFVILSLGLRVRSSFPAGETSAAKLLKAYMMAQLKSPEA